MRKYFWIFLLALSAALLAILFWLRPNQYSPNSKQSENSTKSAIEETADTKSALPNSAATIEQPSGSLSNKAVQPAPSRNRISAEVFRQSVEQKNSMISFYGKVIDQSSNGIPGVQIRVKVRQWFVPPNSAFGLSGRMIPIEKASGVDGLFEIHGETGDGFDIEQMQKDGYRLSPKADRGSGPTGGSPDNPVLFKMWKTGTKEALISGQKVFGIVPDKRDYTLDLLQGKKIEGVADGDLRISISRPNDVTPRDKYKWSFAIEGLQGGVQQSDDEFMYLAPETGYLKTIAKQFEPDRPDWTPMVKMQFFLRSRNGQVYGRADVEVHSLYNGKGALVINYAVNPNGSRNLEP